MAFAAVAPERLLWHRCTLVRGYGVASGQAIDSPYPAGSISLQTPLLAAAGIDLSPYYPGTLNLAFSDTRWQLSDPDAHIEQLLWSDRHPPETFSFWRVGLRWQGCTQVISGLIYWPHPETKRQHHQRPDRLEVLAPWLEGVAHHADLELGVDPLRCRRIRPLLLQARLLETLKFRVLASQEAFFSGFEPDTADGSRAFRAWLSPVLPEALALNDAELQTVLARAKALYCDGIGCNKTRHRSGLA